MSTNIHICGIRNIIVIKTGAVSSQRTDFSAWQTPSTITSQIMAASNKLQVYKDWVLSKSVIINEPVYASDDILCEKEPMGTRIYDVGNEHIKELDQWLQTMAVEGYEIEFEAW